MPGLGKGDDALKAWTEILNSSMRGYQPLRIVIVVYVQGGA
jgi:hypothetical protein